MILLQEPKIIAFKNSFVAFQKFEGTWQNKIEKNAGVKVESKGLHKTKRTRVW